MKFSGANGLITSPGMFSSEWRKPFNISIGLHVIVLAIAMLAPSLFDRQPRLPEIYTVNLYNATEVAPPPAAPVKAATQKAFAKPAVKQIKPEQNKAAVSIQPSKPEKAVVAETTIAKPISLKPRKAKVKVGRTLEEEAAQRARLDKIVQRLQTNAAQKKARETADAAAKDAVSKLADSIKTGTAPTTDTASRATDRTTSTAGATAVSGPRGTGIEPEFYMKQYLATVYQMIHDHWILPELQNWDNSLEAVLDITIRKNGEITESSFEKKSDNIYFNQFVLKAVKDASPLPPFPEQLTEKSIEIGLRFRPGELD